MSSTVSLQDEEVKRITTASRRWHHFTACIPAEVSKRETAKRCVVVRSSIFVACGLNYAAKERAWIRLAFSSILQKDIKA